MKTWLLTVCLLATLAGGRAVSAPMPETPASPPTPSKSPAVKVPLPPELEAQRRELEARENELKAERQQLESEIQQLEAEARQIDPNGRLTSQQLYELLQQRESMRRSQADFDPTPAIVSIFFFGSMLTGFLAWLVASYRKARQLHETVRLMVEKGAEIPQGMLAPVPRRKPSDLRRGIILSTSGLGLAVFLGALPGASGAWGAGVTLLCIGVGHMIVWRLQQGRGAVAAALSAEPQH
ncbi:hypothetical protein ATI61_110320 [Archangium gephyra]|uniref:DUF6249 domain-containing protein n=1 Tax=Archangium gephyra TaxID=48 RepID=A0AAC8QEK1_9BACT|nr:DUF6249 domain-containing protein [Archangium gephyra]AKJ05934.1 Hypothetical protein AA314_07560 [Archangium gephyra]REG27313.1 hypothetical protein ATI61_110320 [Archangium gephyra]